MNIVASAHGYQLVFQLNHDAIFILSICTKEKKRINTNASSMNFICVNGTDFELVVLIVELRVSHNFEASNFFCKIII